MATKLRRGKMKYSVLPLRDKRTIDAICVAASHGAIHLRGTKSSSESVLRSPMGAPVKPATSHADPGHESFATGARSPTSLAGAAMQMHVSGIAQTLMSSARTRNVSAEDVLWTNQSAILRCRPVPGHRASRGFDNIPEDQLIQWLELCLQAKAEACVLVTSRPASSL